MKTTKYFKNNNDKKKLDIQILADENSWIIPYAKKLAKLLKSKRFKVKLIFFERKIREGDILAILSWKRIINKKLLGLHKYNLIIHESALPRGKGWSPLTWQILEGKNRIPITLFEAAGKVDSGRIYSQEIMKFEGHELIDELRKTQGKKTAELILKFVKNYPNVVSQKQKGKETFYKRRTAKDSEIDIKRPIIELFNNFRVADNKKYPVFFKHKGHKYILKIYKEK